MDESSLAYLFTSSDGSVRECRVSFDPTTLKASLRPRETYPEWTRLSFCRCPNCPLEEGVSPRCPAAENLMDVLDCIPQASAEELVAVTVRTPGRDFHKRTTFGEGFSKLLEVLKATSGCPIFGLMRPNVLTHMPFASPGEIVFRNLAMYLLAQFFVERRGGQGDWKLAGLDGMMKNLQSADHAFSQRLKQACAHDAKINVVLALNGGAAQGARAAEKIPVQVDSLEPLFDSYFMMPV